jgi:hypothetical protein
MQSAGSPLASGCEQIGSVCGGRFDNSPSRRLEIGHRIDVRSVVIDAALVTGLVVPGRPTGLHAVVVDQVANGRIQGAHLVGWVRGGSGPELTDRRGGP